MPNTPKRNTKSNKKQADKSQPEISQAQVNSDEAAENSLLAKSETKPDSAEVEALSDSEIEERVLDKASSEIHREQTIAFASLSSELTIEEVQEEAQNVEEENLLAESPLDRYVRKHREVVESGKNAFGRTSNEAVELSSDKPAAANTKSAELSIDEVKVSLSQTPVSITLDPVIYDDESSEAPSAPEKDLKEGELVDVAIFPAPTLTEIYESELAEEKKFDKILVDGDEESQEIPVISPMPKRSQRRAREAEIAPLLVDQNVSGLENAMAAANSDEADSAAPRKSLKKPIIIGLVAAAVLGSAGFAGYKIYQNNQANSKTPANQVTTETSAFKKAYEAFFTDSSHNALKNSNFDKLSSLGDALDAIPTTASDFSTYQTEYNNLSNDISAIKLVNALFNKAAITDGKLDSTVTVKNAVTIPSLSSKNAQLNSLLQQAIGLAKNQTTASSSASAAASLASSQATANEAAKSAAESDAASVASSASNANINNTTESSTGSGSTGTNTATDNNTPGGTVYSQNPTGATPNNSGSRVPIQSVDPNNSAFQWASGVLDATIASMQNRGYISGSNYILEPVAIDTAGEGWYNIYRPDGSYLFSINCKTGFWAGNGGKYPNLPATF